MMMMISYIINEQRKEERYKVLVKRDEQKHEYILIYWGENLLSFLSLSEGRRTRRRARVHTQNKTKQNKRTAEWWHLWTLFELVVFCVFNWHDELLRAQMDDDWTANIVCVCVLFACYLSLEERLPKPKPKQSTRAKKRDFSMTPSHLVLLEPPKEPVWYGAAPPKESQKV